MKRLVYLAGPISGCSYEECTDWRALVRDSLHPSIETISPMRAKDFIKDIIGDNKIGVTPETQVFETHPMSTDKGINTRDYFDVRRSSAVFVNFLGATRVSIGTVMEIAWCRAFNIPVVCVMEKDNIHQHGMLNYACGYIVDTLQQGIQVLQSVLLTDKELKDDSGKV